MRGYLMLLPNGWELRSQNDSMIEPIPTEAPSHCKAATDGVSSSDTLAGAGWWW